MVLFLFSTAQIQPLPDGTEGEVFDTIQHKNKKSFHKPESWTKFDTRFTSIKLGGGILYDAVTYIQDEISKEQIACEPAIKARDIRITSSGELKTKRQINWKIGLMYDGTADEWLLRESGLMISLPEISGNIFIGRTKEGFSMNKIMVGYAGWTMERQMGIDIIPILADGIKYLGFFPKTRVLLSLGIFADYTSKSHSFSTYHWQGIGRIGFLPIYSPSENKLLQIAVNTRYGVPVNNNFRLRSRPESNPSPYFIDTGQFPADYSYHIGTEVYYSSGPWMMGGEYSLHQFYSPQTNHPYFHGGELMLSLIMTGETRPYNTAIGIYGFVTVNKSVFKGGPGAWELVTRITNNDLNSGTLNGGTFWKFTPTLNWYLSNAIRLELVYGYGVLERFGKTGKTHFFQSRIQILI
jgi:phosphate-selective porin OprO/OprP